MNERIRAEKIRLIDENGEQKGTVSASEGLRIATEKGLDLVEVAPDVAPPVCRIMDYSKYKYDQTKRAREAHKKQKTTHLKEIRLKPRIEEHDYQVKLHHLRRFLEENDRIKVVLRFRGREAAHPELGRQLLSKLAEECSDIGEVERKPTREGRSLIMVLIPK